MLKVRLRPTMLVQERRRGIRPSHGCRSGTWERPYTANNHSILVDNFTERVHPLPYTVDDFTFIQLTDRLSFFIKDFATLVDFEAFEN